MELYGSLLNISGSVTASAFTGSFIGDGSGLSGIQASGVTGLNLSQIASGDATASITTSGFTVNKNTQIQGNLSVTGALIANEYIVSSSVIYMTTSFASGSSAFGNDNNDVHQFTGSVQITGSISLNGQAIGTGKLDETTFQSYTSSNNNRVSSLETSSGSLNSFTSSINTTIKSKLDSDNVISGSVQVNITGTTGYSTFSSSISNSFDSLSSSVATTTSGLTSTISSLSSSVATTTSGLTSTITSLSSSLTSSIGSLSSSIATIDLNQDNRLTALETSSGSLNSFTSSINTTIKSKLDNDGVISGSSQILNGSNLVSSSAQVTAYGFATTGSNLFKGTQTHSGSILPSVDNTYDLGSTEYQWRDVYISSGSLYIDGTKVLSSTAQELTITTDSGQSIKILEGTTDSIILQTADGDIELKSSADGDILLDPTNGKIMLKGPVEVLSGQKIQSSVGGTPVVFANDIVVSGSIDLTGTVDGIDLQSLSSSLNTKIGSIETTTGSLNSYTSSNTTNINAIHTATGSLNSFTSSTNTKLGVIESTTSSLNTFTSSTNTRLGNIETSTGSLNSFTSSAGVRLSSIESTTSSLNSYTSSTNSRLNNIETSTGSLNTFSSSANTRLSLLETASGSIRTDFNSYTSSNNTTNNTQNSRLTALETTTGSLNTYTSSNITNINAIHTATSSLNSYTSSTNTRLSTIETSTSSLNTFTSSAGSRLTSIETSTGSLNSYTSSNNTNINAIHTSTSSLNTFTSSINTTIKNKLNTDDVISGSAQVSLTQTTGYNTFSSSLATTDLGQDNRLTSIEGKTGSYATTGSNVFQGSQTITGSLFISQNLIVGGSSSINFVSQSTLNIGTNLITVNAQNPETRFGGLAVIDSGSSPTVSGSMLFDSINDQWIFVHQNQSTVTSSVLLMGPQSINSLGSELYPTTNKILKSVNAEHVGDSNITDTGTKVSVNSNTEITGSLIVAGGNKITVNATGGDEGGEILLGKATTNTTLSGEGVTIDVWQNRLRIFEQGGNARGAYLDISTLANGVGTNLNVTSNVSALESTTASLNSYTSSNNTAISSLNSYTSSNTTNINAIHTATSSLNSYTSSNNTVIGTLQATTSSLNSYTSSNTTNINALHTATSSLNSYTSSNNTNISAIHTATSSLNSYTSSNNTNISAIHTATSSLNSFTSSAGSRLTSIETSTGSLNSYTSSTNTRLGNIETATGSLNSFTSSINTTIKNRLNAEGVFSGSSQVSFNGITDKPTLVSGSSQIAFGSITGVPSGLVSGSSQVLAGTTIHSGSFFNGISVVSGSAQISFNGITDKPTLVSGSSQISFGSISGIPSGLVSGSSQIDLTATTNYSTGIKTRLNAEGVVSGSSQISYPSLSNIPSGIVSGSAQIVAALPSGTVSGSAQIIAGLPSGTVSGSAQITLSSTTGYGSVLNQAVLTSSSPTFAGLTNNGTYTQATTSTQPLTINGDSGDTNGLFRIQMDSVSDSFASGARTYLGDGGIDIFLGTSNSSYTPSNTYIALNHSGEISMGAGSANKHFTLSTSGNLTISGTIGASNFSGSSSGTNTGDQTLNSLGALSSNTDSEQVVGCHDVFWNYGSGVIKSDARWNESGYDGDLGTLHMYSTTAAGANYGRAGIALYNGSAYQYLTTKASTTGLFANNSLILTAGNYNSYALPLGGGTMTGVITTVSSGTAINFSGQSDSFGYNTTSGLGTYIKGTGSTYVYGGGAFYDGSTSRTLLHSGNFTSYAMSGAGYSANQNLNTNSNVTFNSVTGAITSSGNGDGNAPFRFGADYSGWMSIVAGAPGSNNGWGLFWAGNASAQYGTNGASGPGNIWGNSDNPNEYVFVGNGGSRMSIYGNNGNVWMGGDVRMDGSVGVGASPALKFHVRGSNEMVRFENTSTSADQYCQLNMRAGSRNGYIWIGNQNTSSWAGDGGLNIYTDFGNMDLWSNAVQRVRLQSDGHLRPFANNTYDLGTASFGWRNVYTNDLHLSNMGKPEGNDVDGTNGNWTIQEGAENLYIINNNNGKKFKISLEEII